MPLLTGAGSLLFLWPVVTGFRTGDMEFPTKETRFSARRSERPVLFWTAAILNIFLGVFGLAVTIALLITR